MAAVSTFAVKFLGCKVSQADAAAARAALLRAGHVEAPEEQAELHVINTCCITGEAEAKSRQAVRRSLRHAREVVVSGCAVNLDAARFAALDQRVRTLAGSAEDVAAQLAGASDAAPGCADLRHDLLARERARLRGLGVATGEAGAAAGVASEPPPALPPATRTRGFVKVQDGCDCGCAYCIIPVVRGPARSRPASAVLEEIRRRVAAGQPEVVMTGISVGDYRDPERGLELGELMVAAAGVAGVERVRLSSIEVIHLRDSLLEALASEPKVCPHLHVPLQSGDDRVLAAMGRRYSAEEYLAALARLREAVGRVNLTTDVIVGFPTEDEAAFQRTLKLIERAGITRVHTFCYSPRPGTRAAALGDRVPAEVKKERSRRLRGLSELRSRLHRAAKLGQREVVLVDKVAARQCSGYTADYVRCYLPAGAAAAGQLLAVRCRELHADGIACEPL